MFPAIALLAILGAIALLLSWMLRRNASLPAGRIIYIDDTGLERNQKTLYDPDLGLAGRPDYLIQQGRHVFPLEVKSGSAPETAYQSHILQVGAYCRLIEVEYGTRPAFGALRYDGGTFQIKYDNHMERELKRTIKKIRQLGNAPPRRSHEVPSRCAQCGYVESCDQSL